MTATAGSPLKWHRCFGMDAWTATAPTTRLPVVRYYAEKVWSPSPRGYGWYVTGGPGAAESTPPPVRTMMFPRRRSPGYWDGGYYETLSEAKAACVSHLKDQLLNADLETWALLEGGMTDICRAE